MKPLFQSTAVHNLGTFRWDFFVGMFWSSRNDIKEKLVISSVSLCEPISLQSAPTSPAMEEWHGVPSSCASLRQGLHQRGCACLSSLLCWRWCLYPHFNWLGHQPYKEKKYQIAAGELVLEYLIKCHFVDYILKYCSNICKICAGILDWFKVLVYPLALKSLCKVNGKSYFWCDLQVFCKWGGDYVLWWGSFISLVI